MEKRTKGKKDYLSKSRAHNLAYIRCFRIGLLLLILIAIISVEDILAQTKGIEITLKSTEASYSFDEILRIEQYGIVVDDDNLERMVLYKVIKSAKVYDSTYVNMIERYVSNLKVVLEDGVYILDFDYAQIPELKHWKPLKVIDCKYWTFRLRLSESGFDRIEPLEAGFTFSIWPIRNLYHRIAVSTGYPYSSDPSYYVLSFNYGLGIPIYKKYMEIETWVNYSLKYLAVNYESYFSDSLFNIISLESNITTRTKGLPLSLGVRYYLKNIRIEGKETKLVLLLGIIIPIKR